MKRSIIPFLALALLYVTATAQGEWKWAHYWSGQDGSYSSYYNYITNTAFDDEGNIYVYGSMGGSAVFDGTTFQFTTNAEVLSHNEHSVLLAKFDTLGNMLWHKVVKSSAEMAFPLWMELRDDKIYIAGNCGFYGDYSDSWLYYMDTLMYKYQVDSIPVEQQRPPFKAYSRWTFISALDLDGQLIEDHFVSAYSRELYPHGYDSIRWEYNLCKNDVSPMHVGNDGSIYIYTRIQYRGNEESPYIMVVDGDSNRTYDIYLPGNADPTCDQSCLNNAMLYKFSSQGELQFAKIIVDGTDGIAPFYSLGDTINRYFYTYFEGMSFDEEDNMYVSGYVRLAQHLNGYGGELHNYPVHIWWDSTHCLTMNDISSAPYCNFIIKYDTSGNVVWCNQAYTQIQQAADIAYVRFYRNFVGEDAVIICGDAENYYDTGSAIFFEQDVNNSIDRYAVNQRSRAFYVAFDKSTGVYIKNDVLPDEEHSIFANETTTPAMLNNQIVILAITHSSPHSMGIARWNINGSFIDYTPTNTFPTYSMGVGTTIMNNQGYVLFSIPIKGNIAFSENVVVNGDAEHSNAVFALYHDPEYCYPYTDVPSYEESTSTLRLWPNPAQNYLNIGSETCIIDCCEIIDMNGKIVVRKQVWDSQTAINVSTLPAGVYFLKVVCGKEIQILKFVKTYY